MAVVRGARIVAAACLGAAVLSASACAAGEPSGRGAGQAGGTSAGVGPTVATALRDPAHVLAERLGLTALDVRTTPIETTSQAVITLAPAAGVVNLDVPVSVRVLGGQLTRVAFSGPKGQIGGSGGISEWAASSGGLDFDSAYTLSASAVDARGVPVHMTRTFRTVAPSQFLTASVTPAPGTPVGVGLPITVTFNRPVTNRAAVERALRISTPRPIEGAWSWQGNRVVQFRPRQYWPGDITATVHLDLRGVQAGDGLFGRRNVQHEVSFRPALVTRVDAAQHYATVYRNGAVVRVIPITTGKTGWETRSGVKLVLSKERQRIMDASTGGTSRSDPEYYRLLVQYAMRVTYSGEFVHAAPWSIRSQGHANVSHGCIGMSTENARWLYEQSDVGDVVEVVGTPRVQDAGNGMTLWNIPWENWLAGSATGPQMTHSAT